MSNYAVFLDVDGTHLDSFRQVPPSAAAAVRAARANGPIPPPTTGSPGASPVSAWRSSLAGCRQPAAKVRVRLVGPAGFPGPCQAAGDQGSCVQLHLPIETPVRP